MIATAREYSASLTSRVLYLCGSRPNVWQLPNAIKILEFNTLIDGLTFTPGTRVLDIGSGRGMQAQLLANRGAEVVGVDPSEKQSRIAARDLRFSPRIRSRVSFVCGTVAAIETAPPFDYFFSFSVLEHIPDFEDVLRRVRQLLVPGGRGRFTVDALANVGDPSLVELHRRTYAVQRYFAPADLTRILEGNGFTVESVEYILRSQLAVSILTRHLHTGVATDPPARRRDEFEGLMAAERSAAGPGLMLALRVRRT